MIAGVTQRLESPLAPRSPQRKTIVVSGASGPVGSALCQEIANRNWSAKRLVRGNSISGLPDSIPWNPELGSLNFTGFSGADAVVHLAGENIATGRWTRKKKLRIRDSRVVGTHRLCKSLAAMPDRPRVLVCASAIGYYGEHDELLLASIRVAPEQLQKHGFEFEHPDLETALRAVLNRELLPRK